MNNLLWLAVVPVLVTIIGLIFAVLTERVSWSVAFKTAVFMPMAISALRGRHHLANRLHQGAGPSGRAQRRDLRGEDAFSASGVLPGTTSTDDVTGTTERAGLGEDGGPARRRGCWA